MRKTTTGIVAAILVALVASPALAQTEPMEITVSVDTGNVVKGAPGETLPARDPIIPSDIGLVVGQNCFVTLTGMNPGSEHPNNDQILSTGGQSLVAADFEEFAGKITSVSANMVIGEIITFMTHLGEEGRGVSSGGLTAIFDCPISTETTTTTTVPEVTTTITQSTTSTTAPNGDTTTTVPRRIPGGDGGYVGTDSGGIPVEAVVGAVLLAFLGFAYRRVTKDS